MSKSLPRLPVGREVQIARKHLESKYLPKALQRILRCIDSKNEMIAFEASKWLAEMVLGKPHVSVEVQDEGSAALASALASAYRLHVSTQSALPPPVVVDGTVTILPAAAKPALVDDEFPDA